MKTNLLLAGWILGIGSIAIAQEDPRDIENPLQFAKEGDTVEYQIESIAETPVGKTQKRTSVSKLAVIQVDRQLVKLEVTTDQQAPQKVSLTSRGSLLDLLTGSYQDVKITSSSVSRDEIEIDGKTYRCRLIEIQFTAKAKQTGMTVPVKVDQKVWYCEDVPVHGQVKSVVDMEMSILGGKKMRYQTTTSLTGFTSG